MNGIFSFPIVTLSILLCGCSAPSLINPEPAAQDQKDQAVFQLGLVRRPESFGSAVRIDIKLDGKDIGGLKNGAYTLLRLKPGNYRLSTVRGTVFGHDFPVATTNLAGRAGESRYFAYTMIFGPRVESYPIYNTGVDVKHFTIRPQNALWEELDPTNTNFDGLQLLRVRAKR